MTIVAKRPYVYDIIVQCREEGGIERFGDGGDPKHPERARAALAEATLRAHGHIALTGHEVEVIVGRVYPYGLRKERAR